MKSPGHNETRDRRGPTLKVMESRIGHKEHLSLQDFLVLRKGTVGQELRRNFTGGDGAGREDQQQEEADTN